MGGTRSDGGTTLTENDETVQFGACAIDRVTRRLTVAGRPVKLHDRALSLLLYLIDHRDRPVPRGEILRAVWQGVTVADNNVAVQLSKVREALRASPGGEHLIVTTEIGAEPAYRFVGRVALAAPAPTVPVAAKAEAAHTIAGVTLAANRPMYAGFRFATRRGAALLLLVLLLLGGAALAFKTLLPTPSAPPQLSFVVLPFRNQSADRDKDYLADEVTDDLMTDLWRIPQSVVISGKGAAMAQGLSPPEIGRKLNVRYIISGSLTPEGPSYHIVCSMVEAAAGQVVASWQFDKQADQIAAVRGAIVSYIGRELNLTVNRIFGSHGEAGPHGNAGAAELFYRARSRLDHDVSLAGYEAAQHLLEQAVALAPGFVDAKAELGWRLLIKVTNLDDPDDAKDRAEARGLIAEALDAQPDNATAKAAYARELMLDGRCDEATPIAAAVVADQPGNLRARDMLAACEQITMKLDAAVAQYENILRLDPDPGTSRNPHLAIGSILLMQQKPQDAIGHLEQCIRQGEPENDLGTGEQCRFHLIAALDEAGDRDSAKKAYRAYALQAPGRTAWRLTALLEKDWRTLPGFAPMRAALHDAGMPEYADETGDVAPGGDCGPGLFAPTPATLPGGAVLTTAMFADRAKADGPLVIDVGGHRIDLPGAVYFADAALGRETEPAFAARMADERLAGNRAAPVVVAGDGVSGCASYAAASRLVADGYTAVAWYRGGEEAWARRATTNVDSTK